MIRADDPTLQNKKSQKARGTEEQLLHSSLINLTSAFFLIMQIILNELSSNMCEGHAH